MVRQTLTRMARGGIYDQLGGGFHRYSVDQVWLVPHFEKMLYDQAQLALLYLQAWQATGDPEYRRVTEETLDYVVREMTHPEGGFYSTQDADSEGEEGQVLPLGPRRRSRRCSTPRPPASPSSYWGVADGPNFEGRSILHVPRDPDEVAAALGLTPDTARRAPSPGSRHALRAPRGAGQARPGREGAGGLERHDAPGLRRGVARPGTPRLPRGRPSGTPAFLLSALVADGRLLRTWKDGRAKLLGYLEDHAMVVDGLLALHEATPRPAVARRGARAGRRDGGPLLGPARRRGSSTRGGTTRPSSSGRGVSSTRRCPAARRWRPTSCFASRS